MYCPVGKQRRWVKHPHTPRGMTWPVRTLKGPARLDWLGLSREATVAGTHGAMWTMERDSVGCQGRMETIVRSLAILKHWERGVLSLERDGVFFFFFSKTVKWKLTNSWNTWYYCLPNTYHFQQISMFYSFVSVQFSCSVCLILFVPMDCSRPGFPVHHQLL